MRPDLRCSLQHWQGVEYWVVKEPLAQKFYQFPPHVHFLLTQLDGERSAKQILDNYHREYAPRRLSEDQLHSLMQRFHRDGLVLSDSSGQGKELLKRGRKNRRMERLQAFSNILAIRFRGFDPERLLNWMNPATSWLFTRTAAVAVLFFALIALLSVVVNWTEFTSRLPGFEAFFDVRRWIMFAVVVGIAKIIHEFGHGLSCKRFGGECHEIGFMLLVMTPCLYCNVSDSWRLPNKWHRAAIGAAGIYFEIIIATIATFVWWFASPGLVQEICLQFMLVASISTIIFNGNPLLRFDGYYILSDILEIPNLQQKSTAALTTLLGRHWLGLEMPDDPMLPRNRMISFATFTVASTVYKWMIIISILLFLTRWLEPYGLESIGKGMAWVAIAGMTFWPVFKLYRFFSVPGKIMQIKPRRFAIGTVGILGVLGLVMLIPFPLYIRCRMIAIPRTYEPVYAREAGRIAEILVQPGDKVTANQLICRLENEDLELAVAKNRAELDTSRKKRELLKQAQALVAFSPARLSQLAPLEAAIVRLEEIDRVLNQRLSMMELRTSIAGTVIATPFTSQLPGQIETPLIDRHPLLGNVHQNESLARGERLCEVADLENWQAVLLLDEQRIRFVAPGQKLWVRLASNADLKLESTVLAIGVSEQVAGRESRNEGAEAMRSRVRLPDLVAELVPGSSQASIQYFAMAELPAESAGIYRIGQDGHCRIYAGNRSLFQRVRWWFNQNFGG